MALLSGLPCCSEDQGPHSTKLLNSFLFLKSVTLLSDYKTHFPFNTTTGWPLSPMGVRLARVNAHLKLTFPFLCHFHCLLTFSRVKVPKSAILCRSPWVALEGDRIRKKP